MKAPRKGSERHTQALSALWDKASPDILRINEGEKSFLLEEQTASGLSVQYLNVSLVRPNPIQPRRILPERIYQEFYLERLSPSSALKELVLQAQVRARSAGRPFQNPFELLESLDAEEGEQTTLSAEESLLRDLVQLAFTLQNDGQVNPLTVIDMTGDGIAKRYVIETGERRYWATWLLHDFMPNYERTETIPCLIVPAHKASPLRQAKENTSRSGLNAVAMARQVALLLLHAHGYEIPFQPVGMDFYRQALTLDLRGKREWTTEILSALGGISKQQVFKFKNLLKLCDEALELADRYNTEEAKLRLLTSLSVADQVEMLQQIIQQELTVRQIEQIIQKGILEDTNSEDDSLVLLPKGAVTVAKLTLNPTMDSSQVAQAFMGLEKDRNIAIMRIRTMCQLLEEAKSILSNQ